MTGMLPNDRIRMDDEDPDPDSPEVPEPNGPEPSEPGDNKTLSSPSNALEKRLFELAGTIGDENLRRHYGSELRSRLNALTGSSRSGAAGRPAGANAFRPANRSRFGPQPLRGYRGVPPSAVPRSAGATPR